MKLMAEGEILWPGIIFDAYFHGRFNTYATLFYRLHFDPDESFTKGADRS